VGVHGGNGEDLISQEQAENVALTAQIVRE